MRTAWNAVCIDGEMNAFDFEFVFQGDIGFYKGGFVQQVLINPDGIESGISQKGHGIDKGMLLKEIPQRRNQCFGVCEGLVPRPGRRISFQR